MHERTDSFGYESTLDTEPDVSCSSHSKRQSICSLTHLASDISAVLKRPEDGERLGKVKEIMERYSGSDWNMFARDPSTNPDCSSGYERVSVFSFPGLFDLLLLSWNPGAKSPIHNHPCERCFLMALSGSMKETRFKLSVDNSLEPVDNLPIPIGVATWISDDIGLHSISNAGDLTSYSLHCYVPGFTTPCLIYDPVTGISSFNPITTYSN
jgi:predicted metal-dependent enzyme (double-stranded beta helix superfamily)